MIHYRRAAHLMLDIETFGTETDAVVISVGAVWFHFPEGRVHIDQQSELHLNVREQLMDGRKADPATLRWWSDQPDAARNLAAHPDGEVDVKDALTLIAHLNEQLNPDFVWARGASFDFPIMKALAAQYGVPTLGWKFWQERDIRTIAAPDYEPAEGSPLLGGTPHTPTHDCLVQIDQLHQFLYPSKYSPDV